MGTCTILYHTNITYSERLGSTRHIRDWVERIVIVAFDSWRATRPARVSPRFPPLFGWASHRLGHGPSGEKRNEKERIDTRHCHQEDKLIRTL